MSFYNSSAVDRVICLFQAHGLSENSLCMNVHQVSIVQDAVLTTLTENRFWLKPLSLEHSLLVGQRVRCVFVVPWCVLCLRDSGDCPVVA